jgi:hypothetical protein
LIILAAWTPLALGCFLGGEPPVDDDGCSSNHAQFWAPDPSGAELLSAPLDSYDEDNWDGIPERADGECNQLKYHLPGARQDPTLFHVEPILRVTNPDLSPPEEAAVFWTISRFDGEVLREDSAEVYQDDIVDEGEGFSIRPRVFIGEEERGKNLRISFSMELLDANAGGGESPDAGGADAGMTDESGTTTTVSPQAAFYVTR